MDEDVRRLRTLVERFASGARNVVTDEDAATLAARVARGVRVGEAVDVLRLQALGHYHLARFQALDQEPDLRQAMTYYAQLYPVRPDLVPERLHDLIAENADGTRLLRRAIDEDDPAALDGAIEVLTEEAAGADPAVLGNLGTALIRRYHVSEDADDLDGAVHAARRAADLATRDDPQRSLYLSTLTSALRERAALHDDPDELDAAVAVGAEAVAGADGDSRAMALLSLGNALLDRFRRSGADGDVERALGAMREAAASTGADDPRRISIVNATAVALRARFDRSGEPGCLDTAYALLREARSLPGDARSQANAWNNLGTTCATRFEVYGRETDLEEAIACLDRALVLARGTSTHADVLMNLGNARLTRFEQRGGEQDLSAALNLLGEAVRRTREGHPATAERMSNLGLGLSARFEHTRDRSHLEAAVTACRRAVELSDGHVERAAMLGNLGNVLATAAEYSGAMLDLDAALVVLGQAATTVLAPHPDAARHQNNLGLAWRAHFDRTARRDDLDAAIRAHRAAVATVLPGSYERAGYLSNLGVALHARYYAGDDRGDLDDAITGFEDGLDALPEWSRDRPSMMGNLGSALTEQARLTGSGELLERAIDLLREASAAGPDRILSTFHLGTALLRGEPAGSRRLDALAALAKVAASDAATPSLRLSAARTAGRAARRFGDPGLGTSAYQVALTLLPVLSGPRLRRPDQEFHLGDRAGLPSEAAECAISAGRPADALELLERGRSVLWMQRVGLQGALARIRERAPRTARRIEELRDLLDADSLRPTGFGGHGGRVADVVRELRAAGRRAELLREMRELLSGLDGEPEAGSVE